MASKSVWRRYGLVSVSGKGMAGMSVLGRHGWYVCLG